MDDHAHTADGPDVDDSRKADEARRAAAVGLALIRAKHDLNNLFHVARGWSRLLKDPRAGMHQTQEGIDAVLTAAEQTSELISGVLALAGRASQGSAICSLAQELAPLKRGLAYLMPAPDRLKVELSSQALVLCDFAEVHRALIDAVLGVRDALGDDEVLLRVRDTPSGGAEPSRAEVELTLERISRKASNNALPERRLSLRFPTAGGSEATVEAVQGALEPGRESSPLATTRGSASAVLLVDDHRDVRRLATTMLERAGYHVLTASDAEEALITSQNYDGPIHVLCCDAQLPGLPALWLIAELSAARPDLKVLVCTGERPEGKLAEFPRLAKPFSYQQLVSAVRRCLD